MDMPELKLHWAQFETPSFTFDAFGATKAEAMEALRDAWALHAHRTKADLCYLDEYLSDVQHRRVYAGMVFRDGEVLLTKPEPK